MYNGVWFFKIPPPINQMVMKICNPKEILIVAWLSQFQLHSIFFKNCKRKTYPNDPDYGTDSNSSEYNFTPKTYM
jgi:hypothetical protein